MTITESHTGVAHRARTATERSVEIWKQGAKTITGKADLMSRLPTVDLTRPVKRYFEYVQQVVDLEMDLALTWAEMMTSLVGALREEAEKVSFLVRDQTVNVAGPACGPAEEVGQGTREQAENGEPRPGGSRTARAGRSSGSMPGRPRETARQRYQGLTRAELGDKLAERELPRTGTVQQLVERLVSADTA